MVRGLLAMAAPPVTELWLLLLGSVWDLPRPGVKPVFATLAGRWTSVEAPCCFLMALFRPLTQLA